MAKRKPGKKSRMKPRKKTAPPKRQREINMPPFATAPPTFALSSTNFASRTISAGTCFTSC
ncbi:hypothetical protein CWO89_21650 [Bradyrhizobium sp. Leo170]|nr:hypothetical protein CWO89_21650 [Bradyrhizobium sp. Leo170]